MIKSLLSATLLTVIATTTSAETYNKKAIVTSVKPVYEIIYVNKPSTQCEEVKLPIYGTQQKDGNAAGNALLGMIIGGAVGKGLTGQDEGAAVGAVMGGLIGADQGSKPKSETIIIGYETKRQCYETSVSHKVNKLTGYDIIYKWENLTGSFFSSEKLSVGDNILINVTVTANSY